MDDNEKAPRVVEVFDTSVMNSKRVAFSKCMVVYSKLKDPVHLDIEGKMGTNRQLFQNNEILCLEQSVKNLEVVGREPGIKILKKDLKTPPTSDEMFRIKDREVNPKPPATSVVKNIVNKVTGKKPTHKPKSKGKGKKKGKKK